MRPIGGDNKEEDLYLFERLLYDDVDVGHALANLERDLGIDIEIIHQSDAWLAEAFRTAWGEREDPTSWIRPGETGIAHLMGYNPTSDGSDGGASSRDGGNDEDRPCLVALAPAGGSPVVTYPPALPLGSDLDDLLTYLGDWELCPYCSACCCGGMCCRSQCCAYMCCDAYYCCHGTCCGTDKCCPANYPRCCEGSRGSDCCAPYEACCDGYCCFSGVCCGSNCCSSDTDCILDDGNPCTIDSCDSRGCCSHRLADECLDDGLFCNGTEGCHNGACSSVNPPCPPGYCNEAEDRCNDCLSSSECDDGFYCNGSESCTNGLCLPGTPPCPPGYCNEAEDRCNNCILSSDCDDGL